MRTSRRTERMSDSGTNMMMLIITFRNFVKPPKIFELFFVPPILYIHHVQRTDLFENFQIWTTCSQTLTHHFQVADLTLHGICVDLTHVPATIWLPYIPDLKVPCSVIAMRNTNAMIFSDHVCSYSKNCLCIDSKPRHLQEKKWNILNLTFKGPCIVIYFVIKANEMHYFSSLFYKVLYMFRTCPLSIIRSISTLYTRNSC